MDNGTVSPNAGSVYAVWTNFTSTSNAIMFAGSRNQGATWSTPIQISPGGQNGRVQGAQIAVANNGAIFVTYELFCANLPAGSNCPSSNPIRLQLFSRSTNGGASFTSPAPVTPAFVDLTFSSPYRTNSFPALAIAPNGTAFIVYSAQTSTTSPAQVEMIHSGASGAGTHNGFSAPAVINGDTTNENFFPSISIDSHGVIHLSWFDAQASNPEFYSVYASYVKSGKFGTPLQLTGTLDSGNGFLFAPFIGDYAGVVGAFNGTSSEAHPVWTNDGLADWPFGTSQGFPQPGQLQTATLTVP